MESVDAAEWSWVLHGSLIIAAIYGRFARIWSVRNLDLLLIIGLTPALFVYDHSPWFLFGVSGLLAIRLVLDSRFVRRPRVDPNLNAHGLSFLCLAAFVVLVVRVFTIVPSGDIQRQGIRAVGQAESLLQRSPEEKSASEPTTALVSAPALALSKNVTNNVTNNVANSAPDSEEEMSKVELMTVRIVAVLAHAAVVSGLLVIGWQHFGSFTLGLAMASLYLLMPCTAFYMHQLTHVLPAAFLIWAFVAYRRPAVAGSLLAFASGALFSTFFLLPLWATYYGRKRVMRFGAGLVCTGVVLTLPLVLTSVPDSAIVAKLNKAMNWSVLNVLNPDEYRVSSALQQLIRPHIMIVFICVFLTVTIWPRRKELRHLIAHSTVLVVLAQLWYPETQGVYVLWYLPVLLLVIFRPRLRHLEEEGDLSEATRLAKEPERLTRNPPLTTSTLRR